MSQSPNVETASPAYVYAALRIALGLIGCLFLTGLRDVATFWDPAGLIPLPSEGWRGMLIESGWGSLTGRALYVSSLLSYALMAVGFRSAVFVPASFVLASLHAWWNPLPLSAAFEVFQAMVFCLMWADSGAVWSVDAWRAGGGSVRVRERSTPVWPLRLVQYQIALIYFATGLWKLGGEQWRQGTAMHYVLNNNGFARFPTGPPPEAAPLLTAATYLTLLWELAFPFLLLSRWTRLAALLTGVVLHVGMWLTMELGAFPWVMLASYLSFVPPAALRRVVDGATRFRARSLKTQPEVSARADMETYPRQFRAPSRQNSDSLDM